MSGTGAHYWHLPVTSACDWHLPVNTASRFICFSQPSFSNNIYKWNQRFHRNNIQHTYYFIVRYQIKIIQYNWSHNINVKVDKIKLSILTF